ncbi:Eco57I restriction-modification methylase domain-containing protein [Leeuwenhoekiella sp. ZYFB001]|uniref:Eco57I restriction-modification methylase domain-containing protein n=1 Tax=Leeuwenhoekiella sp. ZYFB001 TaxID=2719912 RepID=UPI001430ECB3|nr:N-6 DNA methylase [Leeuwenhoekiella sp. ZYFB001]
MALFQASVLNKYLNAQDQKPVAKAYKAYTAYFLNPVIQENIRKSKEEQFQATFLNELFVSILGYTLNPNPNYNLTTEFKNEKNNRKADGAILKKGSATGVIELKGTNTKDLESIRRQAFDYKANQKGCVYVITSNFEKLRFYINDATEFEEFNLFELTLERFTLLYLCLQHDNLMSDLPLKVKEASIAEEEKITKEFYKDYSVFKRELFRDLVKRNVKRIRSNRQSELEDATTAELTEEERAERNRLQKNIKLTLFKKSQKLIDRFLFIFFAEDRGLLPPNWTLTILDEYKQLQTLAVDVPVYDRFKLHFNYLDQGRKGGTGQDEIYAYNGGLFKPDAILDQLVIDDELLLKHTRKLANYDFASQVDVNILGHIFENSLNEIESVNAEIEGDTFDKQTSKRKKDGVFYTPKYITKYIVENTVGKLCEEKKAELGFEEAEYFKSRKGRNKDTLKKLVAILDDYREWLLQITICDPACGSGAFLNQALDFLIKEHRYIDELKAKVLGGGLVFADIENTILENNIYGVDLNEESVEIAKLSLWLRTAQPRRKLNDLSSNIKCGNSLIDSKAVAGDKAFKWETQFPAVFEKGGFDVVIGNPPYVRQELFSEQKSYLEKRFKVYQGTADLYTYFFELSIDKLLKNKGIYSIIVANKWMQANYGKPLRDWLGKKDIVEIIDFGDLDVFRNVAAYPMIISVFNQSNDSDVYTTIVENLKFADLKQYCDKNKFLVSRESLNPQGWSLIARSSHNLLTKFFQAKSNLNEFIVDEIYYGIKTGLNEAFIIDRIKRDELINKNVKNADIIKPLIEGRNIHRYSVNFKEKYIILSIRGIKIDQYPEVLEHLENYREKLQKRASSKIPWYELQSSISYSEKFNSCKIIYPDISTVGRFYLDRSENFFLNNTAYFFNTDSVSLLGYLNSKVFNFIYSKLSPSIRGGYFRFFTQYMKKVPVPELSKEPKLDLNARLIIVLNRDLNDKINKFQTFFTSQYKLEKVSRKLESWHELEFGEFIKELNKSIKANNKLRQKAAAATVSSSTTDSYRDENYVEVPALTKKDEFEWMSLFEENKKKAQDLQTQINQTEHEIDQMVYKLYGLTEEEIAIVENS